MKSCFFADYLSKHCISGAKSNLAIIFSTKSCPDDVSSKFIPSISNQSSFKLWKPKFSSVSWFGWIHGSRTIRGCHSCQHAGIFTWKSIFGAKTISKFEFRSSYDIAATTLLRFRIRNCFWFEWRWNLSNAILEILILACVVR